MTLKPFLILTVIALLCSCNPCQRLQRKCSPVIRDSISYVETVKFDTITLVSPADTLIIRIPVEPDINDLIMDVKDKPGPSVSLKIEGGIMEIIAVCPEDSLKFVIRELRTELSNQTTVEKIVEVPRMPKIGWIAIIFSSCVIVFIGAKVYLKVKGKTLTGLFS